MFTSFTELASPSKSNWISYNQKNLLLCANESLLLVILSKYFYNDYDFDTTFYSQST